jgi:hypothetical protein
MADTTTEPVLGVLGPLWEPARRSGTARMRAALLSARICPCDPTNAQSCRYCDGTDAEERQARADAAMSSRRARRSA